MADDDIVDDFVPARPHRGLGDTPQFRRPVAGIDRRLPSNESQSSGVTQPTPQLIGKRQTGGSTIIVSPRQKGNPVLNHIKSVPWEYGDIPADFLLGQTTCALFLQLKYHRLHPEYIYTRMRNLQGKYNLRVVLVMVDIANHEESLKELSKTSLINNVTLILCWSAAEGGRYLELFKTFENAAPTSIKQHQSTTYSDRLIDFVTKPRSVNKTDAVSLVSQFGTIRTAINARHDEVAVIAGWGEKKVQRWCSCVREPFRVQRAVRRGETLSRMTAIADLEGIGLPQRDPPDTDEMKHDDAPSGNQSHSPSTLDLPTTMIPKNPAKPGMEQNVNRRQQARDESLDDGVSAALEKLRQQS